MGDDELGIDETFAEMVDAAAAAEIGKLLGADIIWRMRTVGLESGQVDPVVFAPAPSAGIVNTRYTRMLTAAADSLLKTWEKELEIDG